MLQKPYQASSPPRRQTTPRGRADSGEARLTVTPARAASPPLTLTLALALALTLGASPFSIALSSDLGWVVPVGETQPKSEESLMEKKNVYVRAREVVRELAPLVQVIREQDRALADQLKRAAQSVVLNIAEGRGNDAGNARARFSTACGSAKEVRAALNVARDWGYIEAQRATHLDERLDEVCAITWCLGRR